VHETCKAIVAHLKGKYLSTPTTQKDWIYISDGFKQDWQFPNCIGALDGKHCKILPPCGTGSDFYNYKGYFSIVLMALVNSKYEFVYVDVGTNGRVSDGGVWNKCKLKQ